jgi:ribosomal protein L11 methyltransferase
MAQWLKPGETLLDYGCGSGILAIVAARLGAGQVTGIDIDPQALIAAEQNAAKNGIAVRLGLPDALPAQRFDIVVANILANPLIVLEPVIASYCDNRIALSGILEAQAGDVVAAYSQDFDLSVHDTEDGWVLLAGRRK